MKIKLNGKTEKYFLIDESDFNSIKNYKWYFIPDCKSGHVYTKMYIGGKKKTVYLHRYLMVPPKNRIVDHINRDGLDNRRINLRICDQTTNMRNIGKNKLNKSGFLGVSWHKASNRWIAQVTRDNKNVYLGIFSNINDAVRQRSLIQ